MKKERRKEEVGVVLMDGRWRNGEEQSHPPSHAKRSEGSSLSSEVVSRYALWFLALPGLVFNLMVGCFPPPN